MLLQSNEVCVNPFCDLQKEPKNNCLQKIPEAYLV